MKVVLCLVYLVSYVTAFLPIVSMDPTGVARLSPDENQPADASLRPSSRPMVSPLPVASVAVAEGVLSPYSLSFVASEADNINRDSLVAASGTLFQHNQGLLEGIVGNSAQMKPPSFSSTYTKDQTRVTELFLDAVSKSNMPNLACTGPHCEDPTEVRPLIFNYLAMNRCAATKKYLNQCLIAVALQFKTKEGAPLQPSSLATKLRTLFAVFKKQNVPWKSSDFKGFPGAAMDVIKTMWETYMNNHDPDFGMKKREEFSMNDAEAVRKFVDSLSPSNASHYLLHRIQYALGTQLGLRGREEHHDLRLKHIKFGRYGAHDGCLAGKEYILFDGEFLSKTNRMAIGTFTILFYDMYIICLTLHLLLHR